MSVETLSAPSQAPAAPSLNEGSSISPIGTSPIGTGPVSLGSEISTSISSNVDLLGGRNMISANNDLFSLQELTISHVDTYDRQVPGTLAFTHTEPLIVPLQNDLEKPVVTSDLFQATTEIGEHPLFGDSSPEEKQLAEKMPLLSYQEALADFAQAAKVIEAKINIGEEKAQAEKEVLSMLNEVFERKDIKLVLTHQRKAEDTRIDIIPTVRPIDNLDIEDHKIISSVSEEKQIYAWSDSQPVITNEVVRGKTIKEANNMELAQSQTAILEDQERVSYEELVKPVMVEDSLPENKNEQNTSDQEKQATMDKEQMAIDDQQEKEDRHENENIVFQKNRIVFEVDEETNAKREVEALKAATVVFERAKNKGKKLSDIARQVAKETAREMPKEPQPKDIKSEIIKESDIPDGSYIGVVERISKEEAITSPEDAKTKVEKTIAEFPAVRLTDNPKTKEIPDDYVRNVVLGGNQHSTSSTQSQTYSTS